MEMADVVIVGGGIAGAAMGSALAVRGLDVVILERQYEFRDRVRGENMQPWGVVEMHRLGLEDVLIAAGGGYCSQVVPYDEIRTPAEAEAAPVPLNLLVEGVRGTFSVGHPQACEALLRHAEQAGATVVRGVGDVDVTSGGKPGVSYEIDGTMRVLAARLVVGADGRQSTVRRQLGIALEQVSSRASLSGMLVRDESWPHEIEVLGTEGDVHFLVFPRPKGEVRLYLARDVGADVGGADRAERFLEAFHLECWPAAESLARAEPLGPCAAYPGTDSWTDRPFAEGVVLVGDAAGWSDPIIGQGLGIALRDVRLVLEALAGEEWTVDAFEPYADERRERMRRLRIAGHVATELRCTFTPEGRARRRAVFDQLFSDPAILGVMLSPLTGPESAPAELFEDENIQRILTCA